MLGFTAQAFFNPQTSANSNVAARKSSEGFGLRVNPACWSDQIGLWVVRGRFEWSVCFVGGQIGFEEFRLGPNEWSDRLVSGQTDR